MPRQKKVARNFAREMGFDNEDHRIAYLGLLFTEVADNAESDGCDEYWWRTAGLRAVLKAIDLRLARIIPDQES